MQFQKNDLIQLKIEDIGENGEGIGRAEGFTFFVRDALPGDFIEAKVMKLKKRYGYARLMKLLTPSCDRVTPPCPVSGPCGGCQLQALSYEKQLQKKEEKVRTLLEKIGGFSDSKSCILPIIGMEVPFRYRNKAQYPIGQDADQRIISGFYGTHSHRIIPNEDCAIGMEVNRPVLNIVKEWMQRYRIPAYEEETGKGLVRHVLIRCGYFTGQILVCLVINGKTLPAQNALLEELQKIPGMASVSYNINTDRTNVILGEEVRVIWGQPSIPDRIGALTFEISPHSFFQVNPLQTKRLYETALEFAAVKKEDTVLDLYCGIGTISLFLAQRAGHVYGVEIVPQAIEDAKRNAAINGLSNAEFYLGKAEEVVPELLKEKHIRADVIVVDPPRKGCASGLLETILMHAPQRIVYVSCDPATLARDLRILSDGGYRLEKVQPVDMFPHTVHVETVALLSKLNTDKHIHVEIQLDELDITKAEKKATYETIKGYIKEKHNVKVSTLYIAQIKKKYGLDLREHYNISKKENQKIPTCPPEKEKMIVEALQHFGMLEIA